MYYALVTGSSKGIGRAIAEELAKQNYNLLLVARDEKSLKATAEEFQNRYHISAYILSVDLSEAGAAEKIKEWSTPYHEKLKVVVNNAGYGLNGNFDEVSIAGQINMIDVNIKALVELSHAFIPILKLQNKSYLLNVGSTTAYQAIPYLSIYAATKSFVVSFSRGLKFELRNTSVSVTCLSPGSTDTDFINRAGMGESVKKAADKLNMTPEAVAKIAVKGMFAGKSEIIPGFVNKLGAFLPRIVPKILVEKIAGNIYEAK